MKGHYSTDLDESTRMTGMGRKREVAYYCYECGDSTILDTDDTCWRCGSRQVENVRRVDYHCYDCHASTVLDGNDTCVRCGSKRVAPPNEVYYCENCEALVSCDEFGRCAACGSGCIRAGETRPDNFNLEPLPQNQE